MANITIGSGQAFGGTVQTGDIVTVNAGGTASGATVRGGLLALQPGATATGTAVAGVQVVPGKVVVTTGYGRTNLPGTLVVGGSASGTVVAAGGIAILRGGTETGTAVQSGGTLELDGGTSSAAVFAPGATVTVAAQATVDRATVQPFAGLSLRAGAVVTGLDLTPGSFVDLPDLAYRAGGTVTLDATTDRLTIVEGATTVSIPLSGSQAGVSFALRSEFAGANPYAVPGTVLLVTDASGANAAFGFDHAGSGLLLGNGIEPDGPSPQSGQPIAFNSTLVVSYTGNDTVSALGITNAAYFAIGNAGAGGLLPGVYATSLDAAGDQAVYSTIDDGRAHVITATATGRSVIAAGGGHDTVTVRNGADQVVTGQGTNTIYLESGSNIVLSQGSDLIYAGAGTDTIAVSGHTVAYGARARLDIALDGAARLELHTGAGSVTVAGGFGGGTFSGGTDGGNTLIAGTSATTLSAGGDGDALFASGGDRTTLNGWGGHETMTGTYGSGLETFNFNAADVTASSGRGQNVFNVGSGNNVVDTSLGTAVINLANGGAGGSTYLGGFTAAADRVHLAGYASDEVTHALATATAYGGSEILHLRDGTTITFGGVTGLTQSSFV